MRSIPEACSPPIVARPSNRNGERGPSSRSSGLLQQPAKEHAFRRLSADRCNGVDERDLLRTRLDAILRLAASLDAALAHDLIEALPRVHLAARVQVEEAHLI